MRRHVTWMVWNVVLGLWLVASSFLWEHSGAARASVLVAAAVTIAIGLLALRSPGAIALDLAVAAWLVLSVWLVPRDLHYGAWNAVMVAIGLGILPIARALFPTPPAERARA